MRVLLIRHGRSSHAHPRGLLDWTAIERWLAAYDAAGIAADDAAPAALVAEVARADVVASSDLPRAVASAERLACGRPVTVSSLFREVALPPPRWPTLRAPLAAWGTLVQVGWGLAIIRGREPVPNACEQVRAAAAWCRTACRQASAGGGTVAVVTHGVFRRLLARQLLAEGWRRDRGRRSESPWSVWRLSADGGMAAPSPAG